LNRQTRSSNAPRHDVQCNQIACRRSSVQGHLRSWLAMSGIGANVPPRLFTRMSAFWMRLWPAHRLTCGANLPFPLDASQITLKPNLLSHFVHKHPQFGLRRDPESSKSFQEPQPNKINHLDVPRSARMATMLRLCRVKRPAMPFRPLPRPPDRWC
jgi:hypothetical protein